MQKMCDENRDEILRAVASDTGKCALDTTIGEIPMVNLSCCDAIHNVEKWMEPEAKPTPVALLPCSSRVEKMPLGPTLVIGPFNYPFMLALCPCIGAVAAGCPFVLKPSELCPQTGELLLRLVGEYLDPAACRVVLGGKDCCASLLELTWDSIIFTGSERVGKIVASAAARTLTPCTLELGGKSPLFIGPRPGDLQWLAKKIVWGRLFSGGQTCVAPEYVLCPEELVGPLCDELKRQALLQYGDDAQANADYCRMINSAAVERIGSLLKGHGGTVVLGGRVDAAARYVAPTIVLDPSLDSPLMQEEVFGPVLTVLTVKSTDDAVAIAKRMPNPLALYIFSGDAAYQRTVLDAVPSGSAFVNDVVVHIGNAYLPFGGVRTSGLGRSHGYDYFMACTAARVMAKGADALSNFLDIQVLVRTAPRGRFLGLDRTMLLHLVTHPRLRPSRRTRCASSRSSPPPPPRSRRATTGCRSSRSARPSVSAFGGRMCIGFGLELFYYAAAQAIRRPPSRHPEQLVLAPREHGALDRLLVGHLDVRDKLLVVVARRRRLGVGRRLGRRRVGVGLVALPLPPPTPRRASPAAPAPPSPRARRARRRRRRRTRSTPRRSS